MFEIYERLERKFGKKTVLIASGLIALLVIGLMISYGVTQPLEATINE